MDRNLKKLLGQRSNPGFVSLSETFAWPLRTGVRSVKGGFALATELRTKANHQPRLSLLPPTGKSKRISALSRRVNSQPQLFQHAHRLISARRLSGKCEQLNRELGHTVTHAHNSGFIIMLSTSTKTEDSFPLKRKTRTGERLADRM